MISFTLPLSLHSASRFPIIISLFRSWPKYSCHISSSSSSLISYNILSISPFLTLFTLFQNLFLLFLKSSVISAPHSSLVLFIAYRIMVLTTHFFIFFIIQQLIPFSPLFFFTSWKNTQAHKHTHTCTHKHTTSLSLLLSPSLQWSSPKYLHIHFYTLHF